MLVVTNLTKTFHSGQQQVTALRGIDLTIESSAFVAIVGKSGSGKSTLLALLGALDLPSSGSITVNDTNIATLSERAQTGYRSTQIGFVFQQYNLITNLTALENVMLALEFGNVPAGERKTRATELLEQVGLSTEVAARRPAKLSGGQQQRVSIARALANKPAIILADEPTGNLDTQTGEKISTLLRDLAKKQKTTVIIVTHDPDIAARTDRTITIVDGTIK